MHQLVRYHRPPDLSAALALLAEPDRLALAGGTALRHDPGGQPVEVVDLQATGLASVVVAADGTATIGAMVDLQTLVDDPRLPVLLADAARRELPSTLRALATVGGTVVVAEPESLVVAALLVHDATVTLARTASRERSVSLADLLVDGLAPGELLVSVRFTTAGIGAIAGTGRTPADTPIVAAVARRHDGAVRLALCGVADHPVLVDASQLDRVEPVGDHRGSTEYRRHLAQVLTHRVLQEVR